MYGEIEKEMWKSIGELNSEDYVKAGLSLEEAKGFQKVVTDVISRTKGDDPRDQWKALVDECVLKPWHPHPLHQLLCDIYLPVLLLISVKLLESPGNNFGYFKVYDWVGL